jgi:Mce-associated membrane protein
VSGGTRQNAAEKSVPVNEDETPSTAAEIRALAEQAEAEAQEAEALATAARARARALKLRREAELAEAKKRAAEETAAAVPAEAEPEATASVATEAPDAPSDAEVDATEAADDAETVGAEESVGEAEADASADTAQPARRRHRLSGRFRRPKWSTLAASLAVLVIIAALAGSGYMIKEHRDAVQQRQHAAEFVAAARQGVVTLTSLDFNNAKQVVQRILENSTGSFKDDFVKMADDFTKVVEQSKVVSQGSVQAAAVDLDTMTKDSAVVLVASTSEVTNVAGAKQDPRNYRLIVTVARDGGQLKMSKVEFVP